MVFCAEHLLIMCVALAHYLISDVPMSVKIELAKREYLKKEELKKLKTKKGDKDPGKERRENGSQSWDSNKVLKSSNRTIMLLLFKWWSFAKTPGNLIINY